MSLSSFGYMNRPRMRGIIPDACMKNVNTLLKLQQTEREDNRNPRPKHSRNICTENKSQSRQGDCILPTLQVASMPCRLAMSIGGKASIHTKERF
jgi:hypothetical protein